MTGGQMEALHRISSALLCVKTHPSKKVRDSVEAYTTLQIHQAIEMISDILATDDGAVAFKTISAWHSGSEADVLKFLFNDPLLGHYRCLCDNAKQTCTSPYCRNRNVSLLAKKII